MMVQQIENWSIVRGRVHTVTDDLERAGFRIVSLDVTAVEPLQGYASAMDSDAAGTTVEVAVPRDTAEAMPLRAGKEV